MSLAWLQTTQVMQSMPTAVPQQELDAMHTVAMLCQCFPHVVLAYTQGSEPKQVKLFRALEKTGLCSHLAGACTTVTAAVVNILERNHTASRVPLPSVQQGILTQTLANLCRVIMYVWYSTAEALPAKLLTANSAFVGTLQPLASLAVTVMRGWGPGSAAASSSRSSGSSGSSSSTTSPAESRLTDGVADFTRKAVETTLAVANLAGTIIMEDLASAGSRLAPGQLDSEDLQLLLTVNLAIIADKSYREVKGQSPVKVPAGAASSGSRGSGGSSSGSSSGALQQQQQQQQHRRHARVQVEPYHTQLLQQLGMAGLDGLVEINEGATHTQQGVIAAASALLLVLHRRQQQARSRCSSSSQSPRQRRMQQLVILIPANIVNLLLCVCVELALLLPTHDVLMQCLSLMSAVKAIEQDLQTELQVVVQQQMGEVVVQPSGHAEAMLAAVLHLLAAAVKHVQKQQAAGAEEQQQYECRTVYIEDMQLVQDTELMPMYSKTVFGVVSTSTLPEVSAAFTRNPLATCMALEACLRHCTAQEHGTAAHMLLFAPKMTESSVDSVLPYTEPHRVSAADGESPGTLLLPRLFSMLASCLKLSTAATQPPGIGRGLRGMPGSIVCKLAARVAVRVLVLSRRICTGVMMGHQPAAPAAAVASVASSSSSADVHALAAPWLVLGAKSLRAVSLLFGFATQRPSDFVQDTSLGDALAKPEDLLELCAGYVGWTGEQLLQLGLPGDAAAAAHALQQLREQQEQLLQRIAHAQQLCLEAATAGSSEPAFRRIQRVVNEQLISGLEEYAAAVSGMLPLRVCCNNLACSSMAQLSELDLVGGSGSRCSGCRTARYCSRECQLAHWKQHKAACKRLQQQGPAAAKPGGSTGSKQQKEKQTGDAGKAGTGGSSRSSSAGAGSGALPLPATAVAAAALGARELKALLAQLGVSSAGAVEKHDLVQLVVQHLSLK